MTPARVVDVWVAGGVGVGGVLWGLFWVFLNVVVGQYVSVFVWC